MGNFWKISVANPCGYEDVTDYVEIDLSKLGVPDDIDDESLSLFHNLPNEKTEEIPFQIDYPLGNKEESGRNLKRLLTFKARNVPKGPDDYSGPRADFILRKVKKGTSSLFPLDKVDTDFGPQHPLRISHYYHSPSLLHGDNEKDGFNENWFPDRKIYAVKLHNHFLGVAYILSSRSNDGRDLLGAASSVESYRAKNVVDGAGDMLAPYDDVEEKRWAQITKLVFPPAPWDSSACFYAIDLRGKEYSLVWSNYGPIRGIVTLKSEVFSIEYPSPGKNKIEKIKLNCNLYRIIHIYPHEEFYKEDVFVLSENGDSIYFRPCYFSNIVYQRKKMHRRDVYRYGHVAGYLTLWNQEGKHIWRGYGIAANTRIRYREKENSNVLEWQLSAGLIRRSVYYFMAFGHGEDRGDPSKVLGHDGWYRRTFKQLEPVPLEEFGLNKRYVIDKAGDNKLREAQIDGSI